MASTITRINPDLPVCWEDEHTLRVGFERARARVRDPSAGAQRLIGKLLGGIDLDLLASEARLAGATYQEARELLTVLRPALVTTSRPDAGDGEWIPYRLRTLVCDDGREVRGLRDTLSASRLCELDFIGGDPPDLVVLVERFLEPLERAHHWLTSAVPHLPVRYTDQAIHVGPLIAVDGAPCHACGIFDLLGRDESYPILAAQLNGLTPRSETEASTHVAMAIASTFITDWLYGRGRPHTMRVVLPVSNGHVSGMPKIERVDPHPRCGCASLTDLWAADRPRR